MRRSTLIEDSAPRTVCMPLEVGARFAEVLCKGSWMENSATAAAVLMLMHEAADADTASCTIVSFRLIRIERCKPWCSPGRLAEFTGRGNSVNLASMWSLALPWSTYESGSKSCHFQRGLFNHWFCRISQISRNLEHVWSLLDCPHRGGLSKSLVSLEYLENGWSLLDSSHS